MQAQTKSLADGLKGAQQALLKAREGTTEAPKQARQGADRVPTEGRQQDAAMMSNQARQAAAPKQARQVRRLAPIALSLPYVTQLTCREGHTARHMHKTYP